MNSLLVVIWGKSSRLSLNFLFHTLSPLIYLIINLLSHLFLSLSISCLRVLQTLCRGKPFFKLLLLLDLLLLFPLHGSALQPTDSLVHPHLVGEAELAPWVLPWGLPFLRKFFHSLDSLCFPCTMLCIVFMLSIMFICNLSWFIVSLYILTCRSERVRFFADYYCVPDHLGYCLTWLCLRSISEWMGSLSVTFLFAGSNTQQKQCKEGEFTFACSFRI